MSRLVAAVNFGGKDILVSVICFAWGWGKFLSPKRRVIVFFFQTHDDGQEPK